MAEAAKAGYEEVQPPLAVNEASGFGTGQLPDKYRDTLLATDFDGEKMQSVADREGVSLSAIKSRASRGRGRATTDAKRRGRRGCRGMSCGMWRARRPPVSRERIDLTRALRQHKLQRRPLRERAARMGSVAAWA